MSFNSVKSCLALGVGTACVIHGGCTYLTSYLDQNDSQKKLSVAVMSIGMANIALGVGFLYAAEAPAIEPEIEQESNATCFAHSLHSQEMLNPSTCPIRALTTILHNGGSSSIVAKVFEVFYETQGISCDNYLPWQDKFAKYDYIDGIRSEDLSTSAMWGIDPWLRPFITFKAVCNEAGTNVVTLFQRYFDDSSFVAQGGHYMPCSQLHPDSDYCLASHPLKLLTSFFQGEVVEGLKLAE